MLPVFPKCWSCPHERGCSQPAVQLGGSRLCSQHLGWLLAFLVEVSVAFPWVLQMLALMDYLFLGHP